MSAGMQTLLDSPFVARFQREIRDEWPEFLLIMAVTGISDAILRVLINIGTLDAINGGVAPKHMVMFSSMLLIHVVTRYMLLRQAGVAISRIVYGYRTEICDRLSKAELKDVEQFKRSEVELVLGRDVATLGAPSGPIINPLTTCISLVLTLMYLAYLSVWACIAVTLLHAAFVVFFYQRRTLVMKELRAASVQEGDLFTKLSSLLLGFKELKLNRNRREELIQKHVVPLSGQVMNNQSEVNRLQTQNWVFVDSFHYLTMGIPLFVLPALHLVSPDSIAQVVTLVVFTFGSVPEIIIAFSLLSQYDVATQNLESLEKRLERPAIDENATSNLLMKRVSHFEKLELQGLEFAYQDAKRRTLFKVGPVNLNIHRGELLFIVGGNGSGKTTLLRALSGLYSPNAGSVRLNGVSVDDDNLDAYRSFFSAVFTDFHLFDRLYGLGDVPPERVTAMLERFMLQDKTVYLNGKFSTTDLSTGQRKRLALLTALLEERPICILDEVAADQDPEFRKFYYEELLPELKAQGRTLLVVSHDNRYFHVADRVLRLEDGQVSTILAPPPE